MTLDLDTSSLIFRYFRAKNIDCMIRPIVVALLIPYLSLAQKFEISELGGYSHPIINAHSTYNFSPGFSDQFSAGYKLTKHLSAGAFYEVNAWNPAPKSFGVYANADFHHYYFGISAAECFIRNINYKITDWGVSDSTSIKFSPELALGFHLGLRQKLSRNFFIKEQAGVTSSFLNGSRASPLFNNIGPVTFPNGPFSQTLASYYLMVGIECRL